MKYTSYTYCIIFFSSRKVQRDCCCSLQEYRVSFRIRLWWRKASVYFFHAPGSAGENRQQSKKQDLIGAIAPAIPGSRQTGTEKLTGMKDSLGRITKSRTKCVIPKKEKQCFKSLFCNWIHSWYSLKEADVIHRTRKRLNLGFEHISPHIPNFWRRTIKTHQPHLSFLLLFPLCIPT